MTLVFESVWIAPSRGLDVLARGRHHRVAAQVDAELALEVAAELVALHVLPERLEGRAEAQRLDRMGAGVVDFGVVARDLAEQLTAHEAGHDDVFVGFAAKRRCFECFVVEDGHGAPPRTNVTSGPGVARLGALPYPAAARPLSGLLSIPRDARESFLADGACPARSAIDISDRS